MAVIGLLVFSGALALSVAVIALAVGPQWRRIIRLAMGRQDVAFAPLTTLASAERRIAVRRWAATPIPPAMRRLREAA